MTTDSPRGRQGSDDIPTAAREEERNVVEPFGTVDHLGPLSEREHLQREYETDRLIELAARAQMEREDSVFYTNERFIAWLARDLRERMELSASAGVALERIADRVHTRLFAVRLGVADGGPCPATEPVPAATSAEALLTSAARARRAPQWDLSVAAGLGRELWEEPCEGLIPLPPALPSARYIALRVSGDSMTPLIHPGDLLLVRLGRDIARDHVIVIQTPDEGYVVKQVGTLTRRRVELRSLNAAYDPIEIPREPARVLGTVVMRWCDHDARPHNASPSGG
jgi:SOS-response transcriptional repressor LexA